MIIQKAVELGVYEIVPVVTKRTIVKLDAKKEAKKLARWQGISESAAKQSGRGIIPKVAAPMSFNDALKTIVKLDAKKEAKKLARWQGISESAAKQSGRGIIPKVAAPMSFNDALKQAGAMEAVLIPYEKAEGMDYSRNVIKGLKDKKHIGIFIGPEGGFDESEVLHMEAVLIPYEKAEGMDYSRNVIKGLKDKKHIGIFIGPEGGFDESEVLQAKQSGAVPITLGRRILRTETAGLAALAVLMFELDE